MPHIVKSTILNAPTGAVWNVLRDFNGHDRWHPAVATSTMAKTIRRRVVPLARAGTRKDSMISVFLLRGFIIAEIGSLNHSEGAPFAVISRVGARGQSASRLGQAGSAVSVMLVRLGCTITYSYQLRYGCHIQMTLEPMPVPLRAASLAAGWCGRLRALRRTNARAAF